MMEAARQTPAGRAEIFESVDALVRRTADWLEERRREAASEHRPLRLALSGGTTPRALFGVLAERGWPYPRDSVRAFWVDERCVPPADDESNAGHARRVWLDRAPGVPAFRMRGELPPEQAAAEYEQILREEFCDSPDGRPIFDVVLLGMGEDGHTASLFPGSDALEERDRWVVPVCVRMKTAHRVTLTLPVLNSARHVAFLVAGEGKRQPLADVWTGCSRLPAARVRPVESALLWLVDRAAAGA